MSLLRRLCLVTGGGTGIGRAICQALAKEGASVAVAGIKLEPAQETTDTLREISKEKAFSEAQFQSFEVDVSQSGQVDQLIEAVSSTFPDNQPLSVVVNNAGIISDALLVKMSEESFDDVVDVNLKGPFLVTKAVSKLMIEKKVSNGSIVNISSIVGKVGNIGQMNYAAAKGGLLSMTLTTAKELGRFGIRCNAVLPGFIETAMTAGIPQPVMDKMKQRIVLGRMGRPEEVAEVCAFLASDKSSYVTGAMIEVTGGMI